MENKLRKVCLSLIWISLIFALNVNGQDLTIGSGNIFSLGSLTFSLSGNWNNSGTFTSGSSTIIFNGASGTQTITKSGGESFYNITVNKSAGDVQLLSNVDVSGTVTVTSGGIDLNGNILALGTAGTLSETDGAVVKGSAGTITATRTLNAPSSMNVAGMGAEITSGVNLGSVSIARGHAVQTGNGNSSIARYFDISPATNTGLNATFVFHYDVVELTGSESELVLFKSTDGGTSWTQMGGALDIGAHTVTLSGLDGFSRWTLGSSSSPLPVELTSFTAIVTNNVVTLNWRTETEVSNYGFEVARLRSETRDILEESASADDAGWETIGFVQGRGNSNSPKEYTFVDRTPLAGVIQYRLKQIDTDGSFEYSDIVEVETLPQKYELGQNYPNPFNPSTKIWFSIPERGNVKLRIYNTLGKLATELLNKEMEAGVYEQTWNASKYSSGVYIYMLLINGKRFVKKMNLIK